MPAASVTDFFDDIQVARKPIQQQQKRFLNIHEYLSVKLLREYGINAPKGEVANTPQEAYDIAKNLGKVFHYLPHKIFKFINHV